MTTGLINTDQLDWGSLSREDAEDLLALFEEQEKRVQGKRLWTFYPEEGPLRRELYVPHMKFFEAGATYDIRAILAANRVGKSLGIGAFEVTLHATGLYPEWWKGKRFDHPCHIWAAGKTNIKARDVNQRSLVGGLGQEGTGMIPAEYLSKTKPAAGSISGLLEMVFVKHVSGGKSIIVFKSYESKRKSFEGEEVDVIWLDEEPPLDIFGECVIRTMKTELRDEPGLILSTFTPLDGMSETVMEFMPLDGKISDAYNGIVHNGKYVIMATWDDAPHLPTEEKERLLQLIPLYQRQARTKGIPQLGSGAIYPISEDRIITPDIKIPVWYPKIYGLDVGWNWTAAVWLAVNPDDGVAYVYSVYKKAIAEPPIHIVAINARGTWIPGAIDPASQGSGQKDGTKLINEYREGGLVNLVFANNAVETGIHRIWTRLSTGTLKVFESCLPWFAEFRLYRRDEHGHVVKKDDHLMDGTRYAESKIELAIEEPDFDAINEYGAMNFNSDSQRSAVTGY